MKNKDIREINPEEMKRNLAALRTKLAKLRFEISAKQIKNNREIRKTKKEIAQILTVLKEKESNK